MIGAHHIHKWSPSVLMLEREVMPAPSSLERQQRILFPCLGFPGNLQCSLTLFVCRLTLCITQWSFSTLHTGSFLGTSFAGTFASLKLEAGGHWGSSCVPVSISHWHWQALTLSRGAQEGVHCFYLKGQLCLWSYFCNILVLNNHFIHCLILHQSNFKVHWDRGRSCLGLHTDFNKPHGLLC